MNLLVKSESWKVTLSVLIPRLRFPRDASHLAAMMPSPMPAHDVELILRYDEFLRFVADLFARVDQGLAREKIEFGYLYWSIRRDEDEAIDCVSDLRRKLVEER